jgi:hypothetical protein
MPRESFIHEKFTRERTAARKLAAKYFLRFPKEPYQTEVESWRELQSQNIEFTRVWAARREMNSPLCAVLRFFQGVEYKSEPTARVAWNWIGPPSFGTSDRLRDYVSELSETPCRSPQTKCANFERLWRWRWGLQSRPLVRRSWLQHTLLNSA